MRQKSMEGDHEAWITIGGCRGCRRCSSQETAGSAGIPLDVDGHCSCDDNMLVKHCNFDFTTPSLYLSSLTTWPLTQAESAHLDSFCRTQLKYLLEINWPQSISNKSLYQRCQCEPLSIKITEARWILFGHVLRMPRNMPAQMAIDSYFQTLIGVPCWRGRPWTNITDGAQYRPTELWILSAAVQ